jgi:alkylation response protein AidB-like acyl-CoA dehydrogenase
LKDAGLDTAEAVLEECANFNQGVLAPLNAEGDRNPSSLKDGKVTTSPGFKEAFRQFGEGGWQGMQHPAEFGGQGLPKTIGAACIEMLNSANMSFALCPLLTDGAIEALLTAGTPEQQALYLPKMISGAWTGTMNLTEPQAGSDLALVRTRAEPQARRKLSDLRHEDLHHVRRARHGRQHRAPRAGQGGRRARRA